MTVRERVYASRVLERAEGNLEYADSLGISYRLAFKSAMEAERCEPPFCPMKAGARVDKRGQREEGRTV